MGKFLRIIEFLKVSGNEINTNKHIHTGHITQKQQQNFLTCKQR